MASEKWGWAALEAYMYVTKTLYRVPAEHPFVPCALPPWYFANHLPGYPLLIRLFTPGG